MKRSLSFALLALHLLLFVIGGALATESSAMASGRRAVVVASASDGDGAALVALDRGRSEIGTRARRDRGARGASALSLDLVLTGARAAIGPAALGGLRDWRTSVRGHRSLPCVANGARGPPPGR